ncbi:MAG: hypothetical protein ACM3TU_00350 [Bacillota bacterium]
MTSSMQKKATTGTLVLIAFLVTALITGVVAGIKQAQNPGPGMHAKLTPFR